MITKHRTTLIKPRITEKAAVQSDSGVYVFQITPPATKPEVKKEVQKIYNVTVESVNIVNTKGKKTFLGGRRGKKNDIKKAYVRLKKGDSISLV